MSSANPFKMDNLAAKPGSGDVNADPDIDLPKMDAAEMAKFMQKLQELRKKLSDGNISPEAALKALSNKRSTYDPTSWEYGLFFVVVTFLVLVFGKQIYVWV